MLEIPMTRASTDAGRADKTSSAAAKGGKDDAAADADFEATYAADSETEAKTTAKSAENATTSEDVADEQGKVPGAKAEGAPDAAGFDVETLDDVPLPAVSASDQSGKSANESKASADSIAAADDKATVGKARVSDTTELAFAQRLRSGEPRAAPADGDKSHRATARQAQGDVLAKAGSVPADATKAPSQQAPVDTVQQPGKVQAGPDAPQTVANQAQLSGTRNAEWVSATTPQANATPPAEASEDLPRGLRRKLDEIRAAPRAEPATASATQAKQTANAPAPTLPTQGVAQLTAQPDTASLDLQLVSVGDLDAPSSWDARAAAPATLAQTLARPEVPGMIGRQLAEVLQQNPGRPVEISLNPEELGRVRLNISAGEAGITVHVLAERPETLDLMRRHIDQLAREFQALGYDNINFAFNEGQAEQNTGSQDGHDSEVAAAVQDVNGDGDQSDPDMPVRLATTTGVDLRL